MRKPRRCRLSCRSSPAVQAEATNRCVVAPFALCGVLPWHPAQPKGKTVRRAHFPRILRKVKAENKEKRGGMIPVTTITTVASPEVITTMTMLIIIIIIEHTNKTNNDATQRVINTAPEAVRVQASAAMGKRGRGGSPTSLGTAARFAAGPPRRQAPRRRTACRCWWLEEALSVFSPPQVAPKSALVVRRQFVVRHSPVIASCRHLRQQTVELPAFSEQ